MRNVIKVWLFVGILSVALMILTTHFGGRQGLLFGFILCVALNAAIYFFDHLFLIGLFPGRQLEGQDAWGILTKAQALSRQAGVPMPRIFLIDVPTPTVFSVGRSVKHGAILISESLAQSFTTDELEAILAREIIRIRRLDTFAATSACALVSALLSVAWLIDNVILLQFLRQKRPCQLYPMQLVLAPLASLVIRWLAGHKECLAADQLASSLIRDPHKMATVLWKLESFIRTRPMDAPLAAAHLFLVTPLTSCSWSRYFHLQPSVEQRIKTLLGYYPI